MNDSSPYASDAPGLEPTDDRLGRSSFARRVAETIANRRDPTSLVVGIYGEWGDGKTTALNFIRHRLKDFSDVVTVDFNPWLYSNDAELQVAFFRVLVEALGRKLTNRAEEFGEWIKRHSDVVDAVGGVVGVGKLGQAAGKMLSPLDLDELRKRVEQALEEEKKRVIVVIDDIDRLDRNEIFTVFKLVKVAANFRHTAYLLAFDDKVVAAALGDRYPSSPESGANFLDKIVQVPLQLPKVSPEILRAIVLEDVQRVLKSAKVSIMDADAKRFRSAFDGIADERITTLRAVKRLINAIEAKQIYSTSCYLRRCGCFYPTCMIASRGTRRCSSEDLGIVGTTQRSGPS
jgi:predicted KAP-like P-loop ATPase